MDIFKCPWIESIIQELLANISGLQIVGSIQRVNDPKLIFGAACCDIVAFPIRIIYTIVQQMKWARSTNIFAVNQTQENNVSLIALEIC